MAEQDKVALEWVVAPHIADGRVVYTYRNASAVAAGTVSESIYIDGMGDGGVQSFLLDALAAGAEQATHAPVGHDVPDGAVTARVSVMAARPDAHEWDATIEGSVQGHGEGGTLVDGPPVGADATHAPIAVDVTDVELTADELVVTYRIDGGPSNPHVGAFATLKHDDHARWTGGEVETDGRDGVVRLGVPFDLVDGEGWTLLGSVSATSGENMGGVQIQMALVVEDGHVRHAGYSLLWGDS